MRLERLTEITLKSDVMVLSVACRSGPASVMLDGATIGEPNTLSLTRKKFPPD